MPTHTLQEWAIERADELPGAAPEQPFGPDSTVYKVRGKMFLLLSHATGEPFVTVKARPADASTLREAFADIIPGYHMNKRHWISLKPGGALDEALVKDLITESYLLVVETLPRAQRPVDPATFGQHGPEATQEATPEATREATPQPTQDMETPQGLP